MAGTMRNKAESTCACEALTCVTLSACHSHAAQSRGLVMEQRATFEALESAPMETGALRSNSTGACVCATAPNVEKKT